ncbi:unnamed protein product [Mytilus coruscus]|uniref:Uncharacterized protein n=1 Tax=Mytilus coruscus TaxID=42192 RepID=A0A6J8B4A0_MYTCO|nr:unnamed protein product [Mytilus coruscus]
MDTVTSTSAFHTAVAQRKLKLIKILLEGGSNINVQAYDGKTALMIALSFSRADDQLENNTEVIKLLLKHQADPNIQDLQGRTALMYALRYKATAKVVQMLLQFGGDPHIQDRYDKSAFCFIKSSDWSKYINILRPYFKQDKILRGYSYQAAVCDSNEIGIDKKNQLNVLQTNMKNTQEEDSGICIPTITLNLVSERKPTKKNDAYTKRRFSAQVNSLSFLTSTTDGPVNNKDDEIFNLSQMNCNDADFPCNSNIHTTDVETQNAGVEVISSDIKVNTTADVELYRRSKSLFIEHRKIPASVFARRQSCPEDIARQFNTKHAGQISQSPSVENISEDMIFDDSKRRNSDIDISVVDRNILTHCNVKYLPKLPPIEKSSN